MSVTDEQVKKGMRPQRPGVRCHDPDTFKALACAGQRFCLEGKGRGIFCVFKINEDGAICKIDEVEFVDQCPSAEALRLFPAGPVASGGVLQYVFETIHAVP